MFPFSFTELLTVVPIFVLSLTVHEAAHSFMAFLLGDKTSKNMGRFSLNPLNHIDPLGFGLFILFGFGWAKPVMIDRTNLEEPLKDDMLIALAGPISNFLLACVAGLGLRFLFAAAPSGAMWGFVVELLINVIVVNISLGVFNLIPIPPLDGSHIVSNIIEKYNPELAYKFYHFGSRILLLIIIAERMLNVDLLPISKAINVVYKLILTHVVGIM